MWLWFCLLCLVFVKLLEFVDSWFSFNLGVFQPLLHQISPNPQWRVSTASILRWYPPVDSTQSWWCWKPSILASGNRHYFHSYESSGNSFTCSILVVLSPINLFSIMCRWILIYSLQTPGVLDRCIFPLSGSLSCKCQLETLLSLSSDICILNWAIILLGSGLRSEHVSVQ